MSMIEIILSSNTAYVLPLYLISAKVQSRRFKETISHILTKNVILVLHILVCTKWIYGWNIGYLQGSPRDGAYGYVPLNIPPRAPSRTPRLINIQIYIEIYCYSTTGTNVQCFWRCSAYIAVTFHLVSEAEKQDIKEKKKKQTETDRQR